MGIIANPNYDFKLWDFITGDFYKGLSIVSDRYEHLYLLNSIYPIKISLKDSLNKKWTKWISFPGKLLEIKKDSYFHYSHSLSAAIDVHRSMLENEIVIESDYLCKDCKKNKKNSCSECYELNYEAVKVIGPILEEKGFIPHYYYSGGKSIHIHVFFDWNCLKKLELDIQDQLRLIFSESLTSFKKKFMKWLRTKMISCWDTNAKEFDSDLINQSHMIRAELSRNKNGFKTFLGYSHKDISPIPRVCNESNRIYPSLGKIKFSSPFDITSLMNEFLENIRIETKKEKNRRKNYSLGNWMNIPEKKELRKCVKIILSDEFKKVNDGHQRAMFILLNELKSVYGAEQAGVMIKDWNLRMGFNIREEDINYRLKLKTYNLSCKYIHKFLKGIGFSL